jgi:hypothetical protein
MKLFLSTLVVLSFLAVGCGESSRIAGPRKSMCAQEINGYKVWMPCPSPSPEPSPAPCKPPKKPCK